MRAALVGMPNCGKTTLFNRLTGSVRKTGNLPGVTVDCLEAPWLGRPGDTLIDLPGSCSLRPLAEDERVTRDILLFSPPDLILFVLDAVCPRQGLSLLFQVLLLGIPTVLAVNRMDELREGGGAVDSARLASRLSLPVVCISAATGEGLQELVEAIPLAKVPKRIVPLSDPALSRLLLRMEALTVPSPLPAPFLAEAIFDRDGDLLGRLPAIPGIGKCEALCLASERDSGIDRNCRLRLRRYRFAADCAKVFTPPPHPSTAQRTAAADRFFLHPFLGIPIFLLILASVFLLTFALFGPLCNAVSSRLLAFLSGAAENLLSETALPAPLSSFLLDGLLAGTVSVLAFLPTLLLLFFFLALLEESGYLARVSCLTDPLMRRIGLSGRCMIPVLLGFGCTVPAVMACRTLPDPWERRKTVFLIPFMTCSAKLPVFFGLTALFFGQSAVLFLILLYTVPALLGFLIAALSRRLPAPSAAGLLELPPYRVPSPRNLRRALRARARDFLSRAATVVLLAAALVWFLSSFDVRFRYLPDTGVPGSLLSVLGSFLLPVFRPIGIDSPLYCCAILSGLFAKEAVLGTLGALGALTTPLPFPSSLAFLAFLALYPPCVAAFSVTCREIGRGRAILSALLRCFLAWGVSFLLFRLLA